MSSLQGDLDTLKAIISSLLRQFGKGSKTSNGLQSLLDATHSVQIAILQPGFCQRSDAARLLTDVHEITKLAFSNLQDLQFLIHPTRDRGSSNRSPQSETDETARNQAIFSNLSKHAGHFQKFIDIIAGREDWSRLVPKAPRAPSASPDSASRLRPAETGRMTISMPPSPYQPSVEDIDDTDADEEINHNVQHVHYLHKDNPPATPTTVPTNSHPKRVIPPQTPPQVVVRQATDPRQFESSPRRLEASVSPLRAAAGADDSSDDSDSEAKERTEPNLRPSALPKLVTKHPSKTVQQLKDEIARLQTAIDKYAESEATGSESGRPELGRQRTSGKHHSVDLGHSGDISGTGSSRRPRASTSQGPERPKSFVDGSSYGPYKSEMLPPPRPDKLKRTASTKSSRQPSHSPRATPHSAVDQRSDSYWDYHYPQVPQSAANMYGPDPRTSLPTVLEGSRDARTGRLGPRSKRNSAAFEDSRDNFHDFFRGGGDPGAADFPLFGSTSGGPPPPRQPRSRGNSRAQDTSPNFKPYISPRQLHESVPIEPDVREISVSLEDVFFGTVKKYKIRRDKYNAQNGIISQEERMLEVPISRGLKPKSKIKFEGEGHQTPEGTRELHFQLAEKSHPVFTRVDYDLHCTLKITLVEALCGWERSIISIDGKEVRFSHPGPTPASWRDDRAGLGMCLFKNPDQRGDLIAAVSIKYPSPLSEAQKRLIRQALGPGTSPRSSGGFF